MEEIKKLIEQIRIKVEEETYQETPQYISVDFDELRNRIECLERMINAKLHK